MSMTFVSRRERCPLGGRDGGQSVRRREKPRSQRGQGTHLGVVAVLTAADIPGKNDIAPVWADEPLFADKEVMFHGQALFVVAARTRDEARRAARLAKIDIEERAPSVTVADALKTGARVLHDYAFGARRRGRRRSTRPRIGSRANSRSAARSTSIWRVRRRSPFPAKAMR